MTRAEQPTDVTEPTGRSLAADSRERAVGALLRIPRLRKLWTAQFAGSVGDRLALLVLIALAVQAAVDDETFGDGYRGLGFAVASVLGARILATFLFGALLLGPVAALTAPGGGLDRRWTMIGCDGVRVGLLIVAPLWIDWIESMAIAYVVVTAFVVGVAERIWTVAKNSAAPAMLPGPASGAFLPPPAGGVDRAPGTDDTTRLRPVSNGVDGRGERDGVDSGVGRPAQSTPGVEEGGKQGKGQRPAAASTVLTVRPSPAHLEALRRLDLRTSYGALPVAAAVLVVVTLVGNLLAVGVDWFGAHRVALASDVAAGLFAASIATLYLLELPNAAGPRPRSPLQGLRRPKVPASATGTTASSEPAAAEPGEAKRGESKRGGGAGGAAGDKGKGRTGSVPVLVFATATACAAVAAAFAIAVLHSADLGGGPVGYGMLVFALTGGPVVGARIAGRALPVLSRRRLLALAIAVAGLALLAAGIVPDPTTVLLLALFAGLALGITANTAHTLLDHETEESRRSRMTEHLHAVVNVFVALGAVAGPLIAGAIGPHRVVKGSFTFEHGGAAFTLMIAGALLLPVAALVLLRTDDRRGVPLRRDLMDALLGGPEPRQRPAESGFFIAVEGGDGAGKSTQVEMLVDWIRAKGHEVVVTREPGATAIGKRLRSILLDISSTGISHRSEALLYAADRAEHVDSVVRPALARGAVVITDRYIDSSVAYQGAGRDLSPVEVARISRWATDGLVPHLTVLLDIAPETARERFTEAPDRMESEPAEFHQRVRSGFLALAAADPSRYLVVDAGLDPEAVATAVRHRLDRDLPLSEQEIRAREEAERLAAEEARRRAEEEARRKAEEERQERERQEQLAKLRAAEEARRQAEAEEARRQEAERQAEEARRQAEEARRRAEEEARRREEEEEARKREEERVRRLAEEEERLRQEAEARRLEKQRKAEEALLRAEEARRRAEEDAARQAAAAAEASSVVETVPTPQVTPEDGDLTQTVRTPVVGTPTAQAPSGDAPSDEAPSDEAPSGDAPGGGAPTVETATAGTSGSRPRKAPSRAEPSESSKRPGRSGKSGSAARKGGDGAGRRARPATPEETTRTVETPRPAPGRSRPARGADPDVDETAVMPRVPGPHGAASDPDETAVLPQVPDTAPAGPGASDPDETAVMPQVSEPGASPGRGKGRGSGQRRGPARGAAGGEGEPAPRGDDATDRVPPWLWRDHPVPPVERTREMPQADPDDEQRPKRPRRRSDWAEETPLDDLPTLADELLGPRHGEDGDDQDGAGRRGRRGRE